MTDATSDPIAIETSWPSDGVLLIELVGELDILSVAPFAKRLSDLEARSGLHTVIDVSGLTFIDSSGINALVQAVRSIEAEGGSAVIAAPSREATRVFAITRLSQVVPVEQDRQVALAARRTGEGARAPDAA